MEASKTMRKALSVLLHKAADELNGDGCDFSEQDAMKLMDYMGQMREGNQRMSKYEACKYLHISRSTFDRMVAEGKLPKGEKRAGFKELSWRKSDLKL